MGDLPTSHALRAEVARAHKARNPEWITDARQRLREAQLAEHIKRVVDQAPPLTAEQRARLAALLTDEAA